MVEVTRCVAKWWVTGGSVGGRSELVSDPVAGQSEPVCGGQWGQFGGSVMV